MDLIHKFELIKEWYEKQDQTIREREGKSFFRTSHGLWGASGMLDMFEFFLKNQERLSKGTFADYGSGDGRIVLIASLFVDAVGVEGEQELVEISEKAKRELHKQIPELSRASFICGDYYEEKHDKYNIIFTFPDHLFPEEFEKKLLEGFSGTLLVYNNIHRPNLLKKGKTYWVQQIPIVSYACGESGREGRE